MRMTCQRNIGIVLIATALATVSIGEAGAESPLSVDDIVAMALQANPQVRAARERWQSSEHSILPNYAPADPTLSFANLDSSTNGFTSPSSQSYQVSQALQFPGKGYLQAKTARRSADIARLTYDATVRDIRAQAEEAFYQLVLDSASADLAVENVANLRRVLEVTQVAYSANRVTQADFISAEFDLAAAEQQQRQFETATANDKTALNQVLNRAPGEPLDVQRRLDLTPLEIRLDTLIDRASRIRQEILQAALGEENAATALTLAKLEYAPDLTLGYIFDRFLLTSAAPSDTRLQTHGISIGFNLPLFFWLRQRQDVERAAYDLQAARDDLTSIRTQTAAQVTTAYRQAELAYRTALLYRDSLIALAQQGFDVALVAYQGGKIDFVTLANTLRQRNDARVAYLQAANQFLAQRVGLEQAIGEPLAADTEGGRSR
ncbi:MAG: TolC family protein [Candidatus Binatia bacterium]